MIDNVIVFTDGSCTNNGYKNAEGGYGIHFPNGELNDISKKFTKAPVTNQRTELYAIYIALKRIFNRLKFKKVTVYTDSDYSINCLTKWMYSWEKNGWVNSTKQPVKNVDIIKKIKHIISDKKDIIKFIHVRSHTGKNTFEAIHNDIADKLACGYANTCVRDKIFIDTSKLN